MHETEGIDQWHTNKIRYPINEVLDGGIRHQCCRHFNYSYVS